MPMRNFIDSVLLMEAAAPEEEMFSTLVSYYERMQAEHPANSKLGRDALNALDLIEKAKESARNELFKRRDIRTWVARTLRYYLAFGLAELDLSRDYQTPEFVRITSKIMGDYEKRAKGQTLDQGAFMTAKSWMDNNLKHFLGLPYHKIQNYRFDNQTLTTVSNDMRAMEQEFKDRVKGYVAQQPGDEILMTFPDGLVWMMLSRGFCDAEAKAMGHCGNAGAKTGDRIISLRTPKVIEDGVTMYEPHLTFILHRDGKLGEMKGRSNDKPAAHYHDYIVALLRSDVIKGIRGGGYLPRNNFDLDDLPTALRDELSDEKPLLDRGLSRGSPDDEFKFSVGDLDWFALAHDDGSYDRNIYPEESEAMDMHFYTGRDSTVFVLRTSRANKAGDVIYRPHVVAVVDENGRVTQLSGRKNTKPEETYYPAIIKLLEQPYVSSLARGLNFSLDDLDEKVREALIDRKPILGSIADAFKRSGLTTELQEKITGMLGDMEDNSSLRTAFTLEWQDSKKDTDEPELFEKVDRLQVYKWDSIDDFAERFATRDSKPYFEESDGFDRFDTHVDQDVVENFFGDLPIAVRIEMLAKARENYYEDNAIDPDDEDENHIDESDMDLLENNLPEEWQAMENACHTGQEYGAEAEMYKAKIKAIENATPDIGTLHFTTYDRNYNGEPETGLTWDAPVTLTVTPEQIVKELSIYEGDDYLPEEFLVGDMKVDINIPQYGFNDFDDEAAMERFWEESEMEKPMRPTVSLGRVSREAKIEKIKEALAMIPDGMIFKRYDVEKMTDAELDQKLNYIMDQYYGKEPKKN